MDGDEVDALLGLVLDRLEDLVVGELLDVAPDDHAVERNGADRDGTVVDDSLAALVELAARGKVHQRVRPVELRPAELLDLGLGIAADRRGPDVRVDLGRDRPPDPDRIEPLGCPLAATIVGIVEQLAPLRDGLVDPEGAVRREAGMSERFGRIGRAPPGVATLRAFVPSCLRACLRGFVPSCLRAWLFAATPRQMPLVGGNNYPSRGNLFANELRGDILTPRDTHHLGRDDAVACGLKLCHRLPPHCVARRFSGGGPESESWHLREGRNCRMQSGSRPDFDR